MLSDTLEQLNGMIAALDEVASSLERSDVEATTSSLAATARGLLPLPQLQAARNDRLEHLASTAGKLDAHVDDMRVILRYLRSFASTVKVTGAGMEGFDAFACEMLNQITAAKGLVDAFHATLGELGNGVGRALRDGVQIERHFDGLVPSLAENLTADAQRFNAYQSEIAAVAYELRDVAKRVRTRMAKALSALQLGDITRQRVEHVQCGLTLIGDNPSLAQTELSRLLRLLAHQTEDLLGEFNDGCLALTSSLSALAADTKEILALGKRARGGASAQSDSFLRSLEASVAEARRLVDDVDASGQKSEDVCQATASTARALAGSIDHVRSIKIEIQHMAINTSLRCSRMGDAGKPINVVASELRVFADQMDEVSDQLLGTLGELRERAENLTTDGHGGAPLGSLLDSALTNIQRTGMLTANGLKEVAGKGDVIARSVGQSVGRLDFSRELGDVLEEFSLRLEERAAAFACDDAGGTVASDAFITILDRLHASYTMASEREIHSRHFPLAADETGGQPAEATGVEEDDLDAVFF